jgi:hypothetical protein
LATLRSGQLAGLDVSPDTIAHIREFLARSRDATARNADTLNTAVGLAVELHLGSSRGDARLRPAADELLAHPPEVGEATDTLKAEVADDSQRDTYYWYYGSEAMYRLGGDDWLAWSRKFYPQLIQSQVREGRLAGSWDPAAPREADADASGGRIYVTAMNLLSLEISKRQLPVERRAAPQVPGRPQD